ncbi:MAG TPA: type II 3-dehydroquinate dehydratase [Acidimicrobiia bacterium]|nr:type II 3-dehydroquinate dehydratase [Acidimicrobiia bacterium]HEV3451943.1 type II 3-dehydroquinate dehydratase [Acidimicrobiia bacterium]
MATILLLSGPNLNLLGEREPAIYGTDRLETCVDDARAVVVAAGHELEHLQSNHEGELVDAVQGARHRCPALILNAGALTHYSYALADAVATYDGVAVELHLTNPAARDNWRRTSVLAPVVTGTVSGFGRAGYRLAAEAALAVLAARGGARA